MIITPQALRGIYTAFNTVFNKAFISIHALREEGDAIIGEVEL